MIYFIDEDQTLLATFTPVSEGDPPEEREMRVEVRREALHDLSSSLEAPSYLFHIALSKAEWAFQPGTRYKVVLHELGPKSMPFFSPDSWQAGVYPIFIYENNGFPLPFQALYLRCYDDLKVRTQSDSPVLLTSECNV